MRRTSTAKGYTLVEILVVLIIIGILAGLVMLSSGGAIGTSQRAVCAADRRTIKSAYYAEDAQNRGNFAENIQNAMKQMDKNYEDAESISSNEAVYGGICPAGGTYKITTDGNKLTVKCSEADHQDTTSGSASTASKYEELNNMNTELFASSWPNGDLLMKHLLSEGALGDKYGYDGKDYYIKADVKGRDDILLFAYNKQYVTTGNDTGKNLVASYVYDKRTDTWYKSSSEFYVTVGSVKIYDAIDQNKPLEGTSITFTVAPDFQPF